MLTLLVACLLIYKLDLPQWLYLVAMAVWAVEVGVWRFTLRTEDREFVFLENKLVAFRSGEPETLGSALLSCGTRFR